jgi:hypothetical protein
MNAQHAGGARFSVMFGEEAQTVLACCRYGTEIEKKIAKFGMFVRPSPCAYVAPQLRSSGAMTRTLTALCSSAAGRSTDRQRTLLIS